MVYMLFGVEKRKSTDCGLRHFQHKSAISWLW